MWFTECGKNFATCKNNRSILIKKQRNDTKMFFYQLRDGAFVSSYARELPVHRRSLLLNVLSIEKN